eukprot:gnl/MRDRNA2_/MRDRNA2_65866_c0_seq2.p1 gnl/MRDRNA2_/MRDRNA2_65866_c0~~gnl/MRDRNA2_/MRDRNA2_65866_c0_seq2.p1  ORF type:complete len:256 (+),score=55.62 gnl/MRDRNA2_/MRDRNA2_65866_c0_seq2:74-841(+)
MAALADAEKNKQRIRLGELTSAGKNLNGWNACWIEGTTPWDISGTSTPINPAFQALLRGTAGEPPLPSGRAIVPGCGSGCDVIALEAAGYEAIGVEVAAQAVEAARKKLPSTARNAKFIEASFFETIPGEPFDLGYDYTFLCALHPTYRKQWASSWARTLKPGGELVTLMYPVTKKEGGPPYAVTAELYRELLGQVGFVPVVEPRKLADDDCSAGRAGVEWIGRWKLEKKQKRAGPHSSTLFFLTVLGLCAMARP